MTWVMEMKDVVATVRQPYQRPWEMLKLKLKRNATSQLMEIRPKFKHYLNEHVHPSLELGCRFAEESMTKFELIFENIMIIYGKRIEDEHFILERLSVIGQTLFAMLTVISRASRSYCIGLRNSELEVRLGSFIRPHGSKHKGGLVLPSKGRGSNRTGTEWVQGYK